VEHMMVAADTFIRPLTREDKEQIIKESITWFERYGVSSRGTPTNLDEFEAYWEEALEEKLVSHRTAKYGVGYATKGWPRPKQIPAPVWAVVAWPINTYSAFITIGGLPPRARVLLDLPWSEGQEKRYQLFARGVRALDPLYRRLPGRLRMHPIALKAYAREGRRA
ncbi:MAG TPA: oxygenase MpaB family protein, partial [Marmoricola sp.]|nr:oxygenase MpaB family protein [Marmoricola sp.]